MHTEPTGQRRESEHGDEQSIAFSSEGIYRGVIECIPIAFGVAGYGLVFGVIAQQVGLSITEAALMSATVLAGAAQLIALELWDTPLPVATILVTTLIVNLRYVLMGASLRPWFKHLSPLQAYGSIFFTADENWALTMGELKSGCPYGGFLLGSGLTIWLFWVLATIGGAFASGRLAEPSRLGLNFVLPAIFIAIAAGLWEGKSNLLPWTTAGGVAIVSAHYLPGRWYILLGGLIGSSVGIIQYDG